MSRIPLIAISVIVLYFTACEESIPNSQNELPNEQILDTVQYASKTAVARHCVHSAAPDTICATANLSYLRINDAPAASAIQRQLQLVITGADTISIQQVADEFAQSINYYLEDEQGDFFPPDHDLDVVQRATLNSPYLFASETSISVYAGGAHPNFFVHQYTTDPENGTPLHWQDFFNDTTQVIELAKAGLIDGNDDIRNEDELFEYYDWGERGFYLPDFFSLSEQGIEWVWQHYEIAPYAAGTISSSVNYDEVRNFINTDAPLGRYLNSLDKE